MKFAEDLESKLTKAQVKKLHEKMGTFGSLEQAVLKKLLVTK